ncbi:hypothetical protein [Cupriavidus sp. SK-4]|uniref:IS66 family transposase n=1 Tax=Cupriavidus sp. SK-4 TaxID=574750 RepID=UPI00137738ED|nr:hypothetical protein [Cupriavidus sp. SK-4]
MLNLRQLQDQGLQDLAPEDVLALAQQMLAHIQQQEREIKLKDVKIEKITFELARLKAWKFGAKTEAMSAEQRRLFEETLAEDEASLQVQLQQAKGEPSVEDNTKSKRTPRRQPLPAHLRRVEHHHEPEDTHCPTPGCGRTMVRVGEDVTGSRRYCSAWCRAIPAASRNAVLVYGTGGRPIIAPYDGLLPWVTVGVVLEVASTTDREARVDIVGTPPCRRRHQCRG